MLRDLAKSLLRTPPASRLLIAADGFAPTRRFLRRLSYPRVPFDSFADAWSAAACDRHAGHDTKSIDTHRAMAENLRPSDPPVLRILSQLEATSTLRVLDFGGNVGNLYYSYRRHLPQGRQVCWRVVDLPVVVAAGRELAAERAAQELQFSDSLTVPGETFDVILASGSLHYWERGIGDWIAALPNRAPHIIVNRSPVHASRTFVTVQQTESYAVPCIVRSRPALIAEFATLGYELTEDWVCPELSLTFAVYPQLSVASYSGFHFRRKN